MDSKARDGQMGMSTGERIRDEEMKDNPLSYVASCLPEGLGFPFNVSCDVRSTKKEHLRIRPKLKRTRELGDPREDPIVCCKIQ